MNFRLTNKIHHILRSTKIGLSIAITIVIISVIALPFFLNQAANESLVVSSSIVSALASLITLLLAVLLYGKFGVEKSVLDKQTENTLQLLTELKKTRFLCECSDGILQLRLDRLQDKYWKNYKDKKLLFDGGYAEGLKKIWDIANDVFLPVEIAEKINFLTMQLLIENKKAVDYMVVEIPGYSKREKGKHFFGLLNGKQISVEEFVGLWDSVIQTTIKWFKSHSSMPVDFNFERN